MLMEWYALPGKIVVRAAIFALALVLGIIFRLIMALGMLIAIGAVIAVLAEPEFLGKLPGKLVQFSQISSQLLHYRAPAALLLLLFLLAPFAAFFRRLEELNADKIAAQLGFGRQLVAVLQNWLDAGHDDARKKMRWRDLVLATHPPLYRRIRILERRLERERY